MKQLGSLVNPAFLPEIFDAVPKEETEEALKNSKKKALKLKAKHKKSQKK